MPGLEPYKHGYFLWKFVPSAAAAAIFCILFAVASIALVWRIWKTRTWFCIPFGIGGYMQIIGYACRAVASNKTGRLMPFVIQQNNILLAPVLYAAAIYMTLGRVIRQLNGDEYSLVRPTRLTKVFLAGDFTALAMQGSAAGLMVVAEYAKIGQGLAIAGLIFQIITFGIFWGTAAMFHRRMLRSSRGLSINADIPWEQVLRMLYGVSALIMARSIFRLIEFTAGTDGYLLTHEWPLYIFDSIPMLAVMGIFWRWFPSMVGKSHGWRPASSTSGVALASTDLEMLEPPVKHSASRNMSKA
ncbi:rta1 domain-containing protein [Stagonosporopsis vannaccii]|nr:rta1 domain-containing protein [Stagonosporopsis vannaccii]